MRACCASIGEILCAFGRAFRNKLGGCDKAIPPDADWHGRTSCYSTFDGRRLPWKWRNFFRHFLARGKQITFHSWHLLSVATAVGRIHIQILLNKEDIRFLFRLHENFSFPAFVPVFSLLFVHQSEIILNEIFCTLDCVIRLITHCVTPLKHCLNFFTFADELIRFIEFLVALFNFLHNIIRCSVFFFSIYSSNMQK